METGNLKPGVDVKWDFVLSGKISGNPGYRVDFALAVAAIRARYPGTEVWNPGTLPDDRDYRWYMERCVEAIMRDAKPTCVHVRLKGWNRSPGSVAEWALARCLGMRCVELGELLGNG